jgi:hypothetical protein
MKLSKFITMVASLTLHACSSSSNSDGLSAPFKAKIVAYDSTDYSMQTVTFKTLTDVDSVVGTYAYLSGNSIIDANAEISASTVIGDDSLYIDPGSDLRIDYSVDGDGVIIPRNFDSMDALGIYYTYETVLDYWITNFGISLEDFGRLRLQYAPRIEAREQNSKVSQSGKFNAAFLPGSRDFLMFRTSPLESIPFNINLGVIAHEFGHAVFDFKFAGKDATFYDSESEISDENLSGMNEGIADYFAFMMTGRTLDFAASDEAFSLERVPPVGWTLSTLESSIKLGACNGSFYCKGSILNSALYELAVQKQMGLLAIGKMAYEGLALIRNDWLTTRDNGKFDYHFLLNAILGQATEAQKPVMCTTFKKWFDQTSFTAELNCT